MYVIEIEFKVNLYIKKKYSISFATVVFYLYI